MPAGMHEAGSLAQAGQLYVLHRFGIIYLIRYMAFPSGGA